MSWETLVKSSGGQRFLTAILGFVVAFFVWTEFTHRMDKNDEVQAAHIESLGLHIASQGRELDELREGMEFLRDYIKEEQTQRRALFTSIQEHLKELTSHN